MNLGHIHIPVSEKIKLIIIKHIFPGRQKVFFFSHLAVSLVDRSFLSVRRISLKVYLNLHICCRIAKLQANISLWLGHKSRYWGKVLSFGVVLSDCLEITFSSTQRTTSVSCLQFFFVIVISFEFMEICNALIF